ncbi:glutamine amidotransferase [Acerihabitans sp. TG2]|uniref:glutamine amidotransferase n=1 Tax=Acerihabitans sp. TG2 TaxID=3096008 RepID=UPI002B229578|nr:glutamine amidotransferase [Acerihabitans sp. TG2]MEA9389819.1 glutamine amidotransferase [Acerihabitans sp. TG2]
MRKKPLLLLQLGEPPQEIAAQVGEQADWFNAALAELGYPIHLVRPDLGLALPAYAEVSAVMISGSWAMVTDRLPWSERTGAWLRDAFHAGMPMLGICYGHQLLAHALGGTVGDNPNGLEMGLLPVTLTAQAQDDALLGSFPSHFTAYLTHKQSVLVPPVGAQVLATSDMDHCQIIRYSDRVLSSQFHPEFTADTMLACISRNETALKRLGRDVDEMRQLGEKPIWARRLLLDFVNRFA